MEKKKITNDSYNNYNLLEEMIEEERLSGTEVLRLFCDWHGLQLCSKDFLEDLRDVEGYDLPEDPEDEEDS